MLKRLTRVVLYTPDLEAAVRFYAALGAQAGEPFPTASGKGRRVELAFAEGGASLVLHDDPLAQFVDVELETASLEALRAHLTGNPDVRWLRGPQPAPGGGEQLTWRGPDGNILIARAPGDPKGP